MFLKSHARASVGACLASPTLSVDKMWGKLFIKLCQFYDTEIREAEAERYLGYRRGRRRNKGEDMR